MSYDLKLFRKEIRTRYSDFSFLENEEIVTPFTEAQVETLKKRLARYGYLLEDESPSMTTYNFKGGRFGITVYLTKTSLTFQCAGGGQEGIFEILQTSDEFSDSEFLTANLQDGKWSGLCLEDELEAERVGNEAEQQLSSLGETAKNEKNNSYDEKRKRPWWKIW